MPKFRLKRPPVIVARHLLKETFVETIAWLEKFKLVVRHTDDLIIFCKDVPGAKAFYEATLGSWIILTIDPDGAALKMGILGDAAFHDKYELDLPSDEPVITYVEKAIKPPAYLAWDPCQNPETCDIHGHQKENV